MKNNSLSKTKVDPSDIRQSFAEVNIDIHCCRFWKLEEWECKNMAFPFWRLYYNTIPGASVSYRNNTISLSKDVIVIIPPGTSFSASLKSNRLEYFKESIKGSRIEKSDDILHLNAQHQVDHLFIHFNLGLKYDHPEPGIYTFEVNDAMLKEIFLIKENILVDVSRFDFYTTVAINRLIFLLLTGISKSKWNDPIKDHRILKAVRYIDEHLHTKIYNESLAMMVHMAVNSFLRYFKQKTGFSIQQYVQQKRIDKSLVLLHHSNKSLDEIAENCGFCDRFHYSKTFKKIMNLSPSKYRKKLTFQ